LVLVGVVDAFTRQPRQKYAGNTDRTCPAHPEGRRIDGLEFDYETILEPREFEAQ
jgi:hypothetical protein